MTKIIKKSTGVMFTPQEFRLLTQCVRCGKATISDGDLCDKCATEHIISCEMCEILMRHGTYEFYTYDIKEDYRGDEGDFKVSKEFVREFTYQVEYDNPLNTESLCSDCVGWQIRLKNRCRDCDRCFRNTKENYKNNGNFCQKCAEKNHPIITDDNETDDDKLAR